MARNERGSSTLELAVVAPAVLAVLGLAVLAGRIETAHQLASQAAADASRAASIQRSNDAALGAAQQAAAGDLDGRLCTRWTVSLSGTVFPGETLSATVTCTTSLGAFPGNATVTGTARSVVDTYRGVSP